MNRQNRGRHAETCGRCGRRGRCRLATSWTSAPTASQRSAISLMKADLGREKGVGGVFDQLGGLDVGEEHRRFEQIERPVEGSQHGPRRLAVGPDHHPVGPHEVLDRRALAQEFRVRGDIEAALRPRAAQDCRDLAPGADRHCRFGHDHGVIAERPADLFGGGEDVREIGMAVAAPRGCADRDEDGVGAAHRSTKIGGEFEPPGRPVRADQGLEPGLEDRHLAAPQPLDLVAYPGRRRSPRRRIPRNTRPKPGRHIPYRQPQCAFSWPSPECSGERRRRRVIPGRRRPVAGARPILHRKK